MTCFLSSELLRRLFDSRARQRRMLLAALVSCLIFLRPVAAQEPERETRFDSAPVEVDGEVLFRVRGVEAHHAEQRAADIAADIEELASDPSFRPEALHADERGPVTNIMGGDVVVMVLTDEDAHLAGVQRPLLAMVYVDRISRAIVEHRQARTRSGLTASATRVAIAIAVTVGLLALLLWLLRRTEVRLQGAFERRARTLTAESRQILHVESVWRTLRGALGMARFVIVLLAGLFLIEYVLVQFPWTRGAGLHLFAQVSGPLANVGMGLVAAVPDLVFLTILFFITRYVLSLARLYFEAIQRGSIRLRHLEPELAAPTYNLVRAVLIISALVIAYPYIPGSGSEAFKGLSILIGVLLSLGSSSAVANIIAGYMIVYRRGFRIGDRVDIGEVRGIVTEMRMQVTHIRTVKNEEVTIPNAVILGSEVTNYSTPARSGKLILHTEVGIGYQVSRRQVEAMLLEAADRTPKLLKEPGPFVVQLKLGEFNVTYQINAYSDSADGIQLTYSDLHGNILDVFNENGVQIMTPAYEGDPDTPKVVAKENVFAVPPEKERKAS